MDDSNPDLGDIKKVIKKKEITFKNKILQTIDNDLEETAGFAFSSSVRQKTNSAMLEGLQGIGLTKIANDFYYYVGSDKALKLSVNRAVMLRKLVVLDGDDSAVEKEFPDFSKMMSVEFVRNGQYTVLPYPVKYLREFWNYEQRIHPIDPAKFE
ncbi:hypothetical protein FC17_GL002835 [Secundilactobacillus paracollinoides DSM 15502 = JCM 11969]|nr:hypothetical protein FC17_GL002835 [Secundilactobacillus paracollinoides DSM 15502 = JCM 11969]